MTRRREPRTAAITAHTDGHEPGPGNLTMPDTAPVTGLDAAWKELIAEALRRNVVVAVGKHRSAVEAAVLGAAVAWRRPR